MFTGGLRDIRNVGVWITVCSPVLLRLPISSGGVPTCGIPFKGVIGLVEGCKGIYTDYVHIYIYRSGV